MIAIDQIWYACLGKELNLQEVFLSMVALELGLFSAQDRGSQDEAASSLLTPNLVSAAAQ